MATSETIPAARRTTNQAPNTAGCPVTITRLIEGLPADERLAVQKLCKIRGETFEEFARFALWKACQAIELTLEDYAALAVESRSRDGTVTVRNVPGGGAFVEFTGEAASGIQRVAKRKGVTAQAELRSAMANFEAGIARR